MAVEIPLKELSKWQLGHWQRAPEPVLSRAAHYRILVNRFSTDFDSCGQTGRVGTFESRFARMPKDRRGRPHLGAACLAEDVPETQRLVAGSRDDGLPVWRHGLGTKKRGSTVSE